MEASRPGLRVAEVATKIGVSTGTVRNMIRDGRLTGFKPTGHARGMWLVPATDVERHLARTQDPAAPSVLLGS